MMRDLLFFHVHFFVLLNVVSGHSFLLCIPTQIGEGEGERGGKGAGQQGTVSGGDFRILPISFFFSPPSLPPSVPLLPPPPKKAALMSLPCWTRPNRVNPFPPPSPLHFSNCPPPSSAGISVVSRLNGIFFVMGKK